NSYHGKQRIGTETVGGLAAKEFDMWTWCWVCCHSAVLSTAGLIERLGTGFPIPAIGPRLSCPRCGSRQSDARPQCATPRLSAGHGPSCAAIARSEANWQGDTSQRERL